MALSKYGKLYAALAFIFIFNFLFKLIHISSSSFWYDEIISAQDTLLDFGHIKHEAEWDKNPPFYHYVLWVWSKLFGISELGLRSMSAFFSALAAVVIFILANKLKGKTFAILATLVFSIHPFLFYYAQEARCYSFLIFLIACNLLLVHSLVQEPKLWKALLLGVLNFLVFYTHYIAGMILFCQFVYLVFVFRKRGLYLLLIYLTPILLVMLRFTKGQYKVLFFSNESSRVKSNVPLAQLENLDEAFRELYISHIVLLIYVIALLIFIVKKMKTANIKTDTVLQFKLFVLLSPIACILGLYVLGIKVNVFHERYLLFTTPYIILSFFVFSESKTLLYAFAAIALSMGLLQLKFGESRKMDYRYGAALAKQLQDKEDATIFIQTHDVVSLFMYYYDVDVFKAKQSMSGEALAERHIYYFENFDELKQIAFDRSKPILFFQTYQKENDSQAIMNYFRDDNFLRITTTQVEGIQLSYLKRKTIAQ